MMEKHVFTLVKEDQHIIAMMDMSGMELAVSLEMDQIANQVTIGMEETVFGYHLIQEALEPPLELPPTSLEDHIQFVL